MLAPSGIHLSHSHHRCDLTLGPLRLGLSFQSGVCATQDDDPHDWEDAAGFAAGTPSGDVEFELQRGSSRGEDTPGDRKKRAAITKADRRAGSALCLRGTFGKGGVRLSCSCTRRRCDYMTEAVCGPHGRERDCFTSQPCRQYAMLLHQTNLLFLLGRGLLFDRAADDPLLQVCFSPVLQHVWQRKMQL